MSAYIYLSPLALEWSFGVWKIEMVEILFCTETEKYIQ